MNASAQSTHPLHRPGRHHCNIYAVLYPDNDTRRSMLILCATVGQVRFYIYVWTDAISKRSIFEPCCRRRRNLNAAHESFHRRCRFRLGPGTNTRYRFSIYDSYNLSFLYHRFFMPSVPPFFPLFCSLTSWGSFFVR